MAEVNSIFDIRFTFEQFVKDQVILKFSNKQGGDYNVFSSYWQCFVWAAVVGFLYEKPRPLKSPLADKPFSLRTMMNNEGEKDAQALLCMCIAKAGTLNILKNPEDAINLINEYANAGFYRIIKMFDGDTSSYNDLMKVRNEIFGREIQ